PYVMLGVNVFAAESERQARLLLSSRLQATLALRLGRPGPLPPPVAEFESGLGPAERSILEQMAAGTVAGTREQVRAWLAEFVAKTGADELIVAAQIFDHAARLRSYELAAEAAA
ncbi:MAG: LLM class flavin-dependent oxidoreductase, partial [Burkholderiales bacterium]